MAAPRVWGQSRQQVVHAGETTLRRLPRRVQAVVRRLADRQLLLSASSLAFYGLLSALPTLLVSFAVVGAVMGEQTVQRFAEQVAQSGPAGTGRFVDQLVSQGGQVNAVMLLLIAWTATAYGAGLRRVLASAAGRKEPLGLTGLRGRLLGLSFLLALPLLVLAGVPLMFVLTHLSGDGPLATVAGWAVALSAGMLMGTSMITLLYQTFAPEKKRRPSASSRCTRPNRCARCRSSPARSPQNASAAQVRSASSSTSSRPSCRRGASRSS